MVQYICKICLKEFKQKIDYIRHINRKYKCKEIRNPIPLLGGISQNKDNIENNNTCKFCKFM